ncbi:plasmid pRiA4b ORF-3 family protein [Candidatus Finniella inopinata]|uniref:Plasmid pRiA4b ORF-3 family protein n=1 Tax=Candidatus Finniella inopinata TaxID=1696036 RepID=A0A4Q7DH60_9PROT|nr:plasmid pRiA4b ORF-3 family protein [Candidatus Finniella inopinata]RZI45234.1 plasmid pRiA4b ORF-3 family protein [Candidatus Finniella inopinata]
MHRQEFPEIYQFRIYLKGISPLIWRRLLVKGSSSLSDLHYAIQISMGWGDYHLNRFIIWGKDYGVYHDGGINFSDNPKKVYLADFQFRINEKFVYEYDFSDGWEHEIRLEKIVPFDPKKTYPLCIGGRYVCPPEDCGGPLSFMKMKDHYSLWTIEEELKEAIEQYQEEEDWDSFQETAKELKDWYLVLYQPFNRNKINTQLRRYFDSQHKDQLTVEEVQDED